MERTYERRRAPSSAGRTGRGRRQAMDPREKRRLVQLGASIGLFLTVFFGRGLLSAEQLDRWQARLGQDTDFTGAFTRFGAALSRGDPVGDALGGLWVEVFAGGTVSDAPSGSGGRALPDLSQRLTAQIRRPDHPAARWAREAEAAWRAKEAQKQVPPAAATAAGGTVTAAQTLVLRPLAATAQTVSPDGRALPERVSLEYYDLGLRHTMQPVSAPVTSSFGFRESPLDGGEDFHLGVDLGAEQGTKILAYADGVVAFAGENGTYGKYLRLDHGGGVVTVYAHCEQLLVEEGRQVTAGETIAKVGHTGDVTGPHLHFAVLKDNIFLDPLYYIAPAQ